MNLILKQFLELDLSTRILIVADYLVFLLYAISVLYLFFFALSSMFKMGAKYPKAKKKYRYLVLFVAGDDDDIVESVNSFLEQDYPKDKYDIAVISNKISAQKNAKLSELPITLIKTEFGTYFKTLGIQYAVTVLKDKPYDVLVVVDGNDIANNNFLDKVNDAYYSGGMVIQTHRIAKNTDTDISVLDAISEEINNSIFRRGHVNVGLSSGLVGSGMVFSYEWFCENIQEVSPIGLDKQLETKLIEQGVFIEYLNDVYIKGGKSSSSSDFETKRSLWARSTKDNLRLALRRLPMAFIQKNYDYCDKIFQWVMPSRIMLVSTLVVITAIMTLFFWSMSMKWWVLLILLVISFSIAIPDSLVDVRFVSAIRKMPLVFVRVLTNKLKRSKIGK